MASMPLRRIHTARRSPRRPKGANRFAPQQPHPDLSPPIGSSSEGDAGGSGALLKTPAELDDIKSTRSNFHRLVKGSDGSLPLPSVGPDPGAAGSARGLRCSGNRIPVPGPLLHASPSSPGRGPPSWWLALVGAFRQRLDLRRERSLQRRCRPAMEATSPQVELDGCITCVGEAVRGRAGVPLRDAGEPFQGSSPRCGPGKPRVTEDDGVSHGRPHLPITPIHLPGRPHRGGLRPHRHTEVEPCVR